MPLPRAPAKCHPFGDGGSGFKGKTSHLPRTNEYAEITEANTDFCLRIALYTEGRKAGFLGSCSHLFLIFRRAVSVLRPNSLDSSNGPNNLMVFASPTSPRDSIMKHVRSCHSLSCPRIKSVESLLLFRSPNSRISRISFWNWANSVESTLRGCISFTSTLSRCIKGSTASNGSSLRSFESNGRHFA